MKTISRTNLKFSGIYCIINSVNGKKYIGSSKNISNRLWEHRSNLRHNRHVNAHLQNAWNKYGEGVFDYMVLERCEEEQLIKREQYYIDTLKPEYNQVFKIIKPKYTEESKKKMSESRKKGFENGTIIKYQCKPIHQYDLNGNYIQSFPSIKDACVKTGASSSHIYEYLVGKVKKASGYLWSLTNEAPAPYKKGKILKPGNYKPVNVLDLETKELMHFNSVQDCAKFFGLSYVCISDAIRHKRLFHKKYRIYYKNAQ